jgi:KUP system potassium uptake protein
MNASKKDKEGVENAAREQKKGNPSWLVLGTLGVVFGDIGTSPLYALRQCFKDLHSSSVDPASVLGILSLIFWALILVVCIKYQTFITRADHDGEGGTLAMLALIHTKRPPKKTVPPGALILLVLFGSALLYGDGVITPAISVLSAVEGLKIAAPGTQDFVVPVSVGILVGLFLLQSRGTGQVGNLFGPVMSVWFLAIAALGLAGIIQAPQVLQALDPAESIEFLFHHGGTGIVVLGAVVLCFSGAEALFADLSHFGRFPIQLAWYGLVLPALLLNYFGQGALLLLHPAETDAPFFTLVPHALLWPVVVLATLATIIASQALISGAFSLTEQAIHMGYFPRFEVIHTSKKQRGQIYISTVNYALMVACVGIVLGFRSSENLGGAYGLAVIGTMTVTSLTYFAVLRKVWKWPLAGAVALVAFFLALDLAFLAGNLVKIISGAWVPLAIGGLVFAVFWIWTNGGAHYRRALNACGMPLKDFLHEMKGWKHRHPSTGVFLTTRADFVPLVGRNHWLREQAQHEQVLLISVVEESVPYIPDNRISRVEELGPGFWRITASFGFMQHPDITRVLKCETEKNLKIDWDRLVCYLPEASFVPADGWWEQRIEEIYHFLRRNSLSAAQYFRVPPREIILVGVRLEI